MENTTQQDSVAPEGRTEGPAEAEEFSQLLKASFKPRSADAQAEVENAVSTLVKQALQDQSVVKEDILDTVDEMIAQLDAKLTEQTNEILHHPEFQKIESSWRGLEYIVNNAEPDATMKIKV